MSHNIQVVIGRNKSLKKISSKWKSSKVLLLPQSISVIPMTIDLRQEINPGQTKPKKALTEYFNHLSLTLFENLKSESLNGQIGYIETEYFGGMGTQASILFMNGLSIGPFKTENFNPKEDKAINKVLSMLGVKRDNFRDEFDAVGFSKVRNNKDLIEKYAS